MYTYIHVHHVHVVPVHTPRHALPNTVNSLIEAASLLEAAPRLWGISMVVISVTLICGKPPIEAAPQLQAVKAW